VNNGEIDASTFAQRCEFLGKLKGGMQTFAAIKGLTQITTLDNA
jgi:hypothetical protein